MGSSVSSATQNVASNPTVPWQMSCVKKQKLPPFPKNHPRRAQTRPEQPLWRR